VVPTEKGTCLHTRQVRVVLELDWVGKALHSGHQHFLDLLFGASQAYCTPCRLACRLVNVYGAPLGHTHVTLYTSMYASVCSFMYTNRESKQ